MDASMNHFDTEEITLICLYNAGSRLDTVDELKNMMQYLMFDETDLKKLSEQVIQKLAQMSDAEFEQLLAGIAPDFIPWE